MPVADALPPGLGSASPDEHLGSSGPGCPCPGAGRLRVTHRLQVTKHVKHLMRRLARSKNAVVGSYCSYSSDTQHLKRSQKLGSPGEERALDAIC